MAKVSMYDPSVAAYREITDTSAAQFVSSAKGVDADMTANPAKAVFSMYDPAVNVYREINKASAQEFIASAKKVAAELGIQW